MPQAPARTPQRGGNPLPEIPPEYRADPIMALDQPALIAMIQNPGATLFQKAIACKRLSMICTAEAVPALTALLGHERLSHYARLALEPLPDPAADAALRDALPKLSGLLLIGVITSLGMRRDADAVEPLGKLIYSSDIEVARAAAAAVGAISSTQSAALLTDALTRAAPPVRPVVAHAALVCADRLLAHQQRTAVDLYRLLLQDTMPKPVTLSARRAIMALGV